VGSGKESMDLDEGAPCWIAAQVLTLVGVSFVHLSSCIERGIRNHLIVV
jgi:hypothetical protein